MDDDGLTVADVLDRAAGKLAGPDAWIQEAFPNDVDEGTTPESVRAATCFCAYGAIALVLGVSGPDAEMWGSANGVDKMVGPGGLVDFNDNPHRTQREVVAKLREVAALARSVQS